MASQKFWLYQSLTPRDRIREKSPLYQAADRLEAFACLVRERERLGFSLSAVLWDYSDALLRPPQDQPSDFLGSSPAPAPKPWNPDDDRLESFGESRSGEWQYVVNWDRLEVEIVLAAESLRKLQGRRISFQEILDLFGNFGGYGTGHFLDEIKVPKSALSGGGHLYLLLGDGCNYPQTSDWACRTDSLEEAWIQLIKTGPSDLELSAFIDPSHFSPVEKATVWDREESNGWQFSIVGGREIVVQTTPGMTARRLTLDKLISEVEAELGPEVVEARLFAPLDLEEKIA
jgi:hypothetical protein